MKNLKMILSLTLALCLLLCLAACANETGGESTEPSAPETGTVTVPTSEPTEPEDDGKVVYTVKVVDEGGNPISGAMINMCQGDTCLAPSITDESGTAEFRAEEDDSYYAHIMVMPAGYDYATEEDTFYFPAGSRELTITLKAVA